MADPETPVDGTEEELEESSLADDLGAAWDELTGDGDDAGQEVAAASSDGPGDDAAGDEAPAGDDTQPPEGEEQQAAAPEAATAGDDESGDGEAQPVRHVEAPADWSDADREMLAKQSPEGQEFLLRRHREMTAGVNRQLESVAEVRKALEPYRQQIALTGASDGQVVSQLLAAQNVLNTDPEQGLPWLSQRYVRTPEQARAVIGAIAAQHGIDLEADDFDNPPPVDPRYQALEQRQAALEQQTYQRQLIEQQQSVAEIESQISEFRDRRGPNGELAHPHFDKVVQTMGALIQGNQAASMEEAYDKALRLSDDTWEARLAAEREAAAKAREKEDQASAAAAAAEARKRALPRSQANGARPALPPDASIADDLNAAWDALA